MDAAAKYKVNPTFYFTSGNEYVQLVNVASDEDSIFRLNGACKVVFEKLAAGETLGAIRDHLLSQPAAHGKDEIEAFLTNFVRDLTKMGVLQG